MAIKRYTADADTTITNAFKPDLRTRATASNMGLSDSLEVFRIFGQEASGSSELSKILVKFPIAAISADRTNNVLPTSGNVNFYLRVFNAPHPLTLPRNFNLTIAAVSRSWDEGTGMDMEAYSDDGYARWTSAASNSSGVTDWTTPGGDFHANPTFSAYFNEGTEDISIDISDLVEQWLADSGAANFKDNYGIAVHLTNESAASSSYTKKFFARGTQHFFKRPTIEARWDSSTRDDRGSFYYSSSLAPAVDNLNTLYLYNYVRGRLRNIPDIGIGNIFVSLYSGSAKNSAPAGTRLLLPVGSSSFPGGVKSDKDNFATGGYVSTGIYSCSFATTAASAPLTKLFDVWHNGSGIEYFTGSIVPKTLAASNTNPYSNYVVNINNLRSVYYRHETVQFRLFTREKNWCPTIYSKATATPESLIVESGSYKVIRMSDEFDVIEFGTGSVLHTLLSYDATGSYFDLDMSLLEAGSAYGIKFAFYDDIANSWNEYPNVFKFKIEE